jgi:pimeloyl-ACP methyl ester carboxylesterase
VTATRFERTVIVVSKHVLIVLWLIAYLAANARAAEISAPTGIRADGKPADFDHFWSQALVRLQGWPAQPQWLSDVLTFAGPGMVGYQVRCRLQPHSPLPPILYLTDRPECENFDPGNTHSWAMLDLRAVAQATQTTGPDPILQPTYRAILLARRALALLIGKSQPAHLRAGLVGEGSGGGVALALAALCPDQVAFVAAHQPVLSKAGQPYLDLPNFVAGVRCPALLSYGDRDEVAPAEEVIALYEKLRCDRELAEFDGARHCQPKDLRDWSRVWRAWIGEVLGLTSPSPCSTESAATCS